MRVFSRRLRFCTRRLQKCVSGDVHAWEIQHIVCGDDSLRVYIGVISDAVQAQAGGILLHDGSVWINYCTTDSCFWWNHCVPVVREPRCGVGAASTGAAGDSGLQAAGHPGGSCQPSPVATHRKHTKPTRAQVTVPVVWKSRHCAAGAGAVCAGAAGVGAVGADSARDTVLQAAKHAAGSRQGSPVASDRKHTRPTRTQRALAVISFIIVRSISVPIFNK